MFNLAFVTCFFVLAFALELDYWLNRLGRAWR